MRITDLHFGGHEEDRPEPVSETLQLVEPEGDLEEDVVARAIMPRAISIEDADSARRGYAFSYHLGPHLGRGLFRLRIDARDASGVDHSAEVAAGLATSATVPEETRRVALVPLWLVSDRLHLERSDGSVGRPGRAFGRLIPGDPDRLPHRRLFGATV